MIKKILFILFLLTAKMTYGQSVECTKQIDSLLDSLSTKPFNGVVIVSQSGKNKYVKAYRYSDIENKIPLKINDQFVIGSISKQITAVIVLQEYENGHVKLAEPIHTYLPELAQSWADTVTIHHLLTHMHGIIDIDKPTVFEVGTRFDYAYSSLGYDLLAKIVERTSGKSFAELSHNLFAKCKMRNTFHPENKEYEHLVKGYTEKENGNLEFAKTSFRNPVAAGAFISTAKDLAIWNNCLHGGKLLRKGTYELMITKQEGAVRDHPIFGITEYGYGITVDTKNDILQLGQTGYADGFVSMDFYFPKTKTSVVVLENIVYDGNDIKKSFLHHTQILDIMRKSCLIK